MADLYQFFNFAADRSGAPFALCKKHAREQVVPDGTVLNKIAQQAVAPCEKCGKSGKLTAICMRHRGPVQYYVDKGCELCA